MTSAPERIWAAISAPGDEGGVWVPWQIDAPSYTRTDLVAAMIAEAVAKERERCAEIARDRANTFTAVTSGDYWNGEHFAARDIEKAIRTPTPTTEEGA